MLVPFSSAEGETQEEDVKQVLSPQCSLVETHCNCTSQKSRDIVVVSSFRVCILQRAVMSQCCVKDTSNAHYFGPI